MPLPMLAAIFLATAPSPPPADPLAPVRAGKWRCGLPDPTQRTCGTIARYERRPDGGYDVTLDGLLPDGVVIHYRVPLEVGYGALCLTLHETDIARETFTKGGVALVGDGLASQRAQHRIAMAEFIGRQVCSRDQSQDGVFLAEGYVDGERAPDFDKLVKWVDPSDGYTIGPLPGGTI